jgi:redox-sensitive bicupin YhaK (pirin superfamily)
VQVASGSIAVNGQKLEAGDGMAVEGAGDLYLEAEASAEVLLFDMAA